MAPVEIDGNPITGATIDGTDVQEITVDGDVVFTAGPTVIDDFESGNLNNWNDDGANASITTNAISGSFSAQLSTSNDAASLNSFPGDGLPVYPSFGDKIGIKISDTSSNLFIAASFCVSNYNGSDIRPATGITRIFLNINERDGFLDLNNSYSADSDQVSLNSKTVYDFTLDIGKSNSNFITLSEPSHSTLSVSATGNESGGIAFSRGGASVTQPRYDDVVIF